MSEEEPEVLWEPNPGPQTCFMAAAEDEILYGGAKGGGKSDALIVRPLRQIDKRHHKALILRETFSELEGIMARAKEIYERLPERPKYSAEHKRWTFPSGASIKFGYCQKLKDVERYQGQEWSEVNFDELGNVANEKVWIDLMKEVRCKDPTVHTSAAGSANPGFAGHGWIKRRFIKTCGKKGERIYTWKLKGVPGIGTLQKTRRYIPAKVTDNPTYANDPQYLATLYSLPLARRKQLLDGDWDAGLGLALPELLEDRHIIPAFRVPQHWTIFGGFDWGFAHWWVFVLLAVTEDGDLFVIDTIKGRRELPDVIARAIRSGMAGQEEFHREPIHVSRLAYVSSGHDSWAERRAWGENTPTIAERLEEAGLPLIRANIDPVHGLNNLRLYTAWQERGPIGEDGKPTDDVPALHWMDTPGNRWLYDQCEAQVTDPDNPERVLKVDADSETGEGGDDGFQALQYAVASRPPRAPSSRVIDWISGWSKEQLEYEARETRRVQSKPAVNPRNIPPTALEYIP